MNQAADDREKFHNGRASVAAAIRNDVVAGSIGR
jgi:hypothetical protein